MILRIGMGKRDALYIDECKVNPVVIMNVDLPLVINWEEYKERNDGVFVKYNSKITFIPCSKKERWRDMTDKRYTTEEEKPVAEIDEGAYDSLM